MDNIGDFLTRIRNAVSRKKETVEMPTTKMLEAIAAILKDEGFISDFSVRKEEPRSTLVITLKYVNGESAIKSLKRVSKPGIRRYRGYREIPAIKNGMGINIFSTPKGIITGNKAKQSKTGGEYICEIY